jgi:Zn ribbon nucleic-acid-binding protein
LCPDCRQQRRLAWRNERKLYKRKCDATGKNIVSVYSPDKDYIVYDKNYYISDKFDALDF